MYPANLITMHKYLYIAVIMLAVLLVLLFETDILMPGFLPGDNTTQYLVGLASVALTFGGCYLALKLFAFGCIKRQLEDEKTALSAFNKWQSVRMAIIAIMILGDITLYYGSLASDSPKYCCVIAALAVVFCWPNPPKSAKSETLEQ